MISIKMLAILAACITIATAGKLKRIREEVRAEIRIHEEELMQMKLGCSWDEFLAPDGCESCTGICSSDPKDPYCVQMCPVYASIKIQDEMRMKKLEAEKEDKSAQVAAANFNMLMIWVLGGSVAMLYLILVCYICYWCYRRCCRDCKVPEQDKTYLENFVFKIQRFLSDKTPSDQTPSQRNDPGLFPTQVSGCPSEV